LGDGNRHAKETGQNAGVDGGTEKVLIQPKVP
jgi:hypothetical protein